MEIKIAETQREFFGLFQLRTQVFVIEQHVELQIEQDTKDFDAIHYIALHNNQVIGCLRILIDNDFVSVGRVAIKKEFRNQQIGSKLIKAIESHPTVIEKGCISIHSQISAKDFYLKLGYQIIGEPYIEANIMHVLMEKKL